MSKFLLSAPFLLLASGCSKPPVSVPIPPPPASLAQKCDALPAVPQPLTDPDRIQWEADLLYAYASCAARHAALAAAWKNAVHSTEK